MITAEQAAEYLDASLGVSLPTFIVAAAVETVEAVEPQMVAAGYSEATMTLVQCMAVAILAAAGDPRRLQSQSAPSGASRSFKNSDKALTALRRSLAAKDVAGVTTALIGPDPAAGTMLMVV